MNLDRTLSLLIASYRHYSTQALKEHLLNLTLRRYKMDEESEEYALLSEDIEIVREALNRRYWRGKL